MTLYEFAELCLDTALTKIAERERNEHRGIQGKIAKEMINAGKESLRSGRKISKTTMNRVKREKRNEDK